MNEIKITINEEFKYKKLWCEKGHIIANIKNGVDLENYIAGEVIYIPIDGDDSEFVCITEEQHNEILAQLPIPIDEEIEIDDDANTGTTIN